MVGRNYPGDRDHRCDIDRYGDDTTPHVRSFVSAAEVVPPALDPVDASGAGDENFLLSI